jgi:hypothetical protein
MYDKTCSLLTLPVAAYKNQVETAGSFSNSDASLLHALRSEHRNCTNEGFRKGFQKCRTNKHILSIPLERCKNTQRIKFGTSIGTQYSDIGYGWTTKTSWFDTQQGERHFSLSKMFRPAQGQTDRPI